MDPETRLGETAEGVRMVATLATAHPSTVTIRSLMANHLADVASTDQHTVRLGAWF